MKQTLFLVLILLVSSCGTNSKKTNTPTLAMEENFDTDSTCQLDIKEVPEVNKKSSGVVNHPHILEMKANCASLRKVIDMTCPDSKQNISIENPRINKKFYEFDFFNSRPIGNRDSATIHLIAKKLGLSIEHTRKTVEHIELSINDSLLFTAITNTEQGDTIRKKHSVSRLYYRYENTPIDEILIDMSEHFNKVITFKENTNPRIDYRFETNHWGETATVLKKKCGLNLEKTQVPTTFYILK